MSEPVTEPTEPIPDRGPGASAQSRGPLATSVRNAGRRVGFTKLVGAELRRLGDTTSGRALLITAPILVVLVNLLSVATPQNATVKSQIGTTMVSIEFGQLIAHAAVIKLITGEWLYRALQPTLLVQPSRRRYLLAQASVASLGWLGCSLLQICCTLLLGPLAAAHSGVPYLLGDRLSWTLAVCVLGSLLGMLAALTASLLLLNPAGALAGYIITAPVLVVLASVAPRLFSWISPYTPATELATLEDFAAPGPAITSLALWLGLLATAGYCVTQADIG